ncbi:uncharacterized protein V1478_015617 [Vespula squamosa]|uniref:Uncharacterized protein n=1 Tax=Vespula squamosa TaxID=30214 RepID=A0ABD2A1T7_VESSQ
MFYNSSTAVHLTVILKIRQPFEKNQRCVQNTWNNKSVREERDWIVDIIKRYKKVTEYVDMINNLSRINYLIAIFFAMILITFDFLYLLNYSDAASEELCNIPFYMLSINTQKLLLFMIARSAKPCVLSIGGMFISSHEVFIGVSKNKLFIGECIDQLDVANVSYFTMSARGVNFFEQHFLLSNRLVQFVLGLRPNQSSNDQLFLLCTIIAYVLPILVHQIFIIDFKLKTTVMELRKIIGAFVILSTYSATYFHFVEVKLLSIRFKQDCEQLSDEDELNIMEKYTKQSKSYVYVVVVSLSLYIVSITFSCILNVILYLFGILDDNQLTLPIPVDVSNAGALYYCLLIYQTIAFYIVLILGNTCFAVYLVAVQNACCQFTLIILQIQKPFKKNSKCMQRCCHIKTSREEWDWIVDIINRYKKVAELVRNNFVILYVEILNSLTKVTSLITIFFAMILVVFDFVYIFQISIELKNASEIIEYSFYISGSIFTIYLNFYVGQKLLNHGDAVFEELCQIPFYNLSRETQKLLLFMIQRSMKPSMLSVGGLYVSAHQVFAQLMEKAFSFAMVYYMGSVLTTLLRRQISYFTMATRGVSFFEQHFFLSNRLVQLVLGLRPNQSSNRQLFLLCGIIVYVLPIIIYQLYQLFMTDFNLTMIVIEGRKIIGAFIMLSAYCNINFHFVTLNLLLIRFKHDCEHLSDEMELNIMEKYMKQTKTYAYAIVVLSSFYVISITFSCILNVILYLFGILDDSQLTLPILINNLSNFGVLYYFLLIYQTIAFYIVLIIGCVFFVLYLVIVQHACCLFSIIIITKYLNVILHVIHCRWKIQQHFTNDPKKYIHRILCSQRSRQEFYWIIDIIKRYKNVTECQIPFYLLPTKTQKLLLFMIARSMKPCMLSIGGLFVSSNELFSQFLQKAFSFAMKVRFDATKVRYTIMSRRSLTYFEQHFLFSNRLVTLLLGLHPNRSSNNQLFLFCMLYLLIMLKPSLQSSVKMLHKLFAVLIMVLTYSTTYFCFITVEKYTRQSKWYTYIVVGKDKNVSKNNHILYITSMTFPSILNVLLYILGVLDDKKLTLPFIEYDGLIVGALYYNLLLYQLIGALIILTIGCLVYSTYLTVKIREQFKIDQKYTKMVRNCKTLQDEHDWIIDIINHYRNVTEYVHLINCFSEITYLIVVFFAMILVVFDFLYIYQLSEIWHSLLETIECSVNIFTSILVLYLNFYVGQKLLNHSSSVFDELCQIPFYNLSMKSQKLLLFMIMRSMKPCMLSIGEMFVSSHKIFAGYEKKENTIKSIKF